VCGSDDATIRLLEGDTVSLVAHYGTISPGAARRPLSWHTPGNEAMLQRRTVHVPDALAETERFPDSGAVTRDPRGIRTFLATPLLREGTAIGVINIRRTEVKPFTDKQVALLETFASQAVIAIENVRLFQELEARTRELARSRLASLERWVRSDRRSALPSTSRQSSAPLCAMRSSSHEPMVVSFTNTMRLRKSSISGQTILWKQRSLRRCRLHRSGRVKGLRDERRLCASRSNSPTF
jgi:GAF domain-containing protein